MPYVIALLEISLSLHFLLIINCKKVITTSQVIEQTKIEMEREINITLNLYERHHFKVCGILFAANFYLSDIPLLTSDKKRAVVVVFQAHYLTCLPPTPPKL